MHLLWGWRAWASVRPSCRLEERASTSRPTAKFLPPSPRFLRGVPSRALHDAVVPARDCPSKAPPRGEQLLETPGGKAPEDDPLGGRGLAAPGGPRVRNRRLLPNRGPEPHPVALHHGVEPGVACVPATPSKNFWHWSCQHAEGPGGMND